MLDSFDLMRQHKFLYSAYRFVARSSFELRRRIAPGGYFVFALLLLGAVVGIDTNRSFAYQLFTLACALFFFGVVWNLFARRPQFAFSRKCPEYATVESPFRYRVSVKNTSQRAIKSAVVAEWIQAPIPTENEFVQNREPLEKRRNWFDRRFIYYRWRWLSERKEQAEIGKSENVSLKPGEVIDVEIWVNPTRRGILHLNEVRLLKTDLFGLFYKTGKAEGQIQAAITVLPKRYELARKEMRGKSNYQPAGLSISNTVGQSEEFIGLRDYSQGDSIRHIHWKSWARQGKPIVKEFEDEYFPRYALILDTFQDEVPDAVFEEAVSVAASFSYQLDTQESFLDLMFVGQQAHCFTSGRGISNAEKMLEILATVQPSVDKGFESLCDLVRQHSRDLSSAICVFIDWDDSRQKLVEQLKMDGISVSVWILYDPRIRSFDDDRSTNDIHFVNYHFVEAALATG